MQLLTTHSFSFSETPKPPSIYKCCFNGVYFNAVVRNGGDFEIFDNFKIIVKGFNKDLENLGYEETVRMLTNIFVDACYR